MHQKLLHTYLWLMCGAAALVAVLTDWNVLLNLPLDAQVGLVVLIGVGILSESLAIRFTVGKASGNTSITFIPLLASVQLFGPPAAVLLIAVTGATGEFLRRKQQLIRNLFNFGQLIVAAAVAGWVFNLFGGEALNIVAGPISADILFGQLLPFIAFGLVFLALNHAAVSLAIALSQGMSFTEVWGQILGHSGASLQDLLISPIAIAVAFLYIQYGVMGIILVLFPLLFIRRSYLTTSQLREANRHLLQALVKAIETRDPYTSGHSMRVSALSKTIAEHMGLQRQRVQEVETAALLHDIGKIEGVYNDILKKPGALTEEERDIIESHVSKGAELLTALTSYGDEVILPVRHHHEHVDGSGYPDGLVGDRIPLGARIIKVCDAIDAMLSDRPYRKALTTAAVYEQLELYTGVQFDASVVEAVLENDLITAHRAALAEDTAATTGEPRTQVSPEKSSPKTRGDGSAKPERRLVRPGTEDASASGQTAVL